MMASTRLFSSKISIEVQILEMSCENTFARVMKRKKEKHARVTAATVCS